MDKKTDKHLKNILLRLAMPKRDRFIPTTALTLMLIWFCGIMPYVGYAKSQSQSSRSYQISKLKTAFLYNFIRFVDWPEEKMGDENSPIIIGIIGKDSFGNAIEPIKVKKVKGREVVLKRFKSFAEIKRLGKESQEKELEIIGQSHLLFVCNSEKAHIRKLTNLIRKYNVLTVGDLTDFLENGGIIHFALEGNKIRFDINLGAAKSSNLKIRSQLLRLAKTIIKDDTDTNGS